VWWDPHLLTLGTRPPFGIRRDDLIAKDGDPAGVAARLAAYEAWQAERAAAAARARTPSLSVRTATDAAAHGLPAPDPRDVIDMVDVSRSTSRPFGPRFGTLVHAALATVPLDADERVLRSVAATQGRILLAADEDVYAAVEVVTAVLGHPLFDRVRAAALAGQCHRELPVVWRSDDGALVEGTIDLAFTDEGGTMVIDFKTDRELAGDAERYRRQLAIYCRSVGALTGGPVRGVLMKI
jgi:ATP-dependent exoDNAse (exonuclease V) beta subunit